MVDNISVAQGLSVYNQIRKEELQIEVKTM